MRQYIGARYVPKFDGDWDNTKPYEAMVVVSYNGNSYTSKKNVPVGVSPTNTSYWALTGDYNSLVSELREKVDAIDDMFYDVDYLKTKKYIFIGDSYSEFDHSWLNLIKYKLDLTEGENCFSFSQGGTGFTIGFPDWIGAITNLNAPDDIDYIIVLGGYNDRGGVGIVNAIESFCNVARGRFPKAKILIGFVGWNAHEYDSFLVDTFKQYKEGAKSAGAVYIDNIEYALHNYSYVAVDGFHPVNTGSASIYNSLLEFLMSGHTNVYITGGDYVTNESDITGSITYEFSVCNGKTTTQIDMSTFTTTATQLKFDGTPLKIGKVPGGLIGRDGSVSVPAFINNGVRFYNLDCCVLIKDCELFIKTIQVNADGDNFKTPETVIQFDTVGKINFCVDSMKQI